MRQQERELESLEKQAEELHEKQAQAHLLSLLSPCDGWFSKCVLFFLVRSCVSQVPVLPRKVAVINVEQLAMSLHSAQAESSAVVASGNLVGNLCFERFLCATRQGRVTSQV